MNDNEELIAQAKKEREERALKRKRKNARNAMYTKLAILLLCLALLIPSIVKIVRLKEENRRLLVQQEELKKERNLLKAKLKNINSKDYIQEEARKQLKMMDPDEILYVFDDEE